MNAQHRLRELAYQIWEARQHYPHLFSEKDALADWLTAEALHKRGRHEAIANIQHLLRMARADALPSSPSPLSPSSL